LGHSGSFLAKVKPRINHGLYPAPCLRYSLQHE
jgi:hypothetical protein